MSESADGNGDKMSDNHTEHNTETDNIENASTNRDQQISDATAETIKKSTSTPISESSVRKLGLYFLMSLFPLVLYSFKFELLGVVHPHGVMTLAAVFILAALIFAWRGFKDKIDNLSDTIQAITAVMMLNYLATLAVSVIVSASAYGILKFGTASAENSESMLEPLKQSIFSLDFLTVHKFFGAIGAVPPFFLQIMIVLGVLIMGGLLYYLSVFVFLRKMAKNSKTFDYNSAKASRYYLIGHTLLFSIITMASTFPYI